MRAVRPDTPSAAATEERFVRLLEGHRKILYKVAGSYARTAADRQDLVQEMAVQLWRSFGRYDATLRFSTWMYRIALNVAISFFRAESRKARTFVPAEDRILDVAAAPAASPGLEDDLERLWQAISTLDELDRALVVLYLDGQSYETIAQVVGLSQTNVGTKINRIKNKLRRELSVAG
jgi:RNA polymerase sigma factor (sigma-70 family)